MHASVRKYKVDPAQLDQVSQRISDTFVPRVSEASGFVAYYVVDAGSGILITVTVGDDLEGVQRSTELAAEFVRDELTDVEIERVEAAHGEVRVSQAS
jgi:3-oxoacyl-ACP reductase-like protein